MKKSRIDRNELTAKQRLAVSRQSLAAALGTPIWASLIEWGIKRYERPEQSVTTQSTQVANGRTPS